MVVCTCGAPTQIRTSWTTQNPGRRFHRCNKPKPGQSCGFVAWAEPPMIQNPAAMIPGLLDTIKNLEDNAMLMFNRNKKLEENAIKLAKENKMLKVIIGLSWFLFMVYYAKTS
ncbi:putative transcription factor GRF family [Helianthus annuus]|nr:putative transcription factor GRF family [Helianthus annuus]